MENTGPTPKVPKEFVLLMAYLTSLMAFSIDAILPALEQIGIDLGFKNTNDTQYIISIIFLGFGFGLFLFGPLSDAFGRKKPIYIGAVIFIIGCLTSYFAENLEVMLLGRFFQGLGASSFRIISIAIVRDKYNGATMARITSLIMTFFILVPVMAPSIGQIVLNYASWKAIILLFLGICFTSTTWFALRQEETLTPEKRKDINLKHILRASIETLTTPLSLISIIISGLIFGGFIAYLSSSQIIFQKIYLQKDNFPLLFGGLAFTVGVSSLINSFLVQKFGLIKLVNFALKLMVISLLPISLYFTFSNQEPALIFFYITFAFLFFLVGLLFGNLNALAMAPLGHIAGVASSVIGAVQNMISVLISVIIISQITTSTFPLVIGFLLVSSISALTLNLSLKYKYLLDDI